MKKSKLFVLISILILYMLPAAVYAAASISYTQSGADSGTVMKGQAFTVTVSGLSGSGTVTLVLPTGFSTSEDTTKSFASGTTSVSWTTAVANQKLSSQVISAIISTTGSPTTVETSSFDVILPPSISVSVNPNTASVSQGSTFSVSLNIQNNGETTARFGTISISPSDFSKYSGCSPSTIPGSQSAAVSCTIKASSSAQTGTRTVSLIVTPSNAGSVTKTVSVSVSSTGGGDQPGGGGTTGGAPGAPPAEKKNVSHNPLPPGLLNNTKLLSSIEKVLAKGKLNQNAIDNLIELSNIISKDSSILRTISVESSKSEAKTTVKYKGSKTAKNYVIYDKVPKDFANASDLITVSASSAAKIEIVESDPEYAVVFETVNPNDELAITYTVNKSVSADTINLFSTELYAESLEEQKTVCAQVITPAENPETGECRNFPTPCDVPNGWTKVDSCPAASGGNASTQLPGGVTAPGGKSLTYIVIAIVILIIVAVIALKGSRKGTQMANDDAS